ncbi:universal stress protein [Microbacterium hatanonis]
MRLGLDLTLLHVVQPINEEADAEPRTSRFSLADAVASSRSVPGIKKVTGETCAGDPMEELTAASIGADVVVVGSHKTGFLHGRVFGSRSLRLLASAVCPVAVVPEPTGRTRRGVAVGVDGSDASRDAVRFAAKEAAALGQPLMLVCGGGYAPASAVGIDVVSRADRLLAAARDIAVRAAPSVRVVLRPLARPAAEALADAAPTSILLVVPISAGSGAMIGPTAHDVLMNLAGPTLFLPAR